MCACARNRRGIPPVKMELQDHCNVMRGDHYTVVVLGDTSDGVKVMYKNFLQ